MGGCWTLDAGYDTILLMENGFDVFTCFFLVTVKRLACIQRHVKRLIVIGFDAIGSWCCSSSLLRLAMVRSKHACAYGEGFHEIGRRLLSLGR